MVIKRRNGYHCHAVLRILCESRENQITKDIKMHRNNGDMICYIGTAFFCVLTIKLPQQLRHTCRPLACGCEEGNVYLT